MTIKEALQNINNFREVNEFTLNESFNVVICARMDSKMDVSSTLPDQTKRHIDLAYLTGVFNVSGIDGLQKELTRLKEIGKNPHDIFSEGNYR